MEAVTQINRKPLRAHTKLDAAMCPEGTSGSLTSRAQCPSLYHQSTDGTRERKREGGSGLFGFFERVTGVVSQEKCGKPQTTINKKSREAKTQIDTINKRNNVANFEKPKHK